MIPKKILKIIEERVKAGNKIIECDDELNEYIEGLNVSTVDWDLAVINSFMEMTEPENCASTLIEKLEEVLKEINNVEN